MLKEALFYKKKGDKVLCTLCPHNCCLSNGQLGICRARMAAGGKLYSLNYGEITSINMKPIKEKSLLTLDNRNLILSLGSFGCNFKCGICKNHNMSEKKIFSEYLSVDNLIKLALTIENNRGITFTYNEPFIFYEYMYDVCKKASEENIDVCICSNGYVNPRALEAILPYVSVVNIDLKAFNGEFYKDICFGDFYSVLENIKLIKKFCNVEITTMIVEGYNDSLIGIKNMCRWIAFIDPNIPFHIVRYHSNTIANVETTSKETINMVECIANKYLNYIFVEEKYFVQNNYIYKCLLENKIEEKI